MARYSAPLRDMRFVYHELFDSSDISALPGFEEATPDLIDAVLEEAAKVCENELFPINRSGDEEGCRYHQGGDVTTPSGFRECYRAYAEAGWIGLSSDPQYGGQGLPAAISTLLEEMVCSSNIAFGTYVGLSRGAYRAIAAFGNDTLKTRYLPKLTSGEWSGTMCLTEPQCGTDLGLLRTRAEPNTDGSYRVTGNKIFISAGEHDLTENIIHLVLARLPDAPAGVRGISLFLVPKFLPNPDGDPGERNGVLCTALENKMGIKASATCAMSFDQATGWLIGSANKGMQAMFVMMNDARLGVGVQGLGLSESAYQAAVEYARERLQGRSVAGTKHPDKSADPILVHPDIRRTLLTMRALTEGNRAMATWIARHLDLRERAEDETTRASANDFVQLMTPIAKAFFTDYGFDITNMGLQVYGGHGYIRENGVEQYVRDSRIAQIYEGANGVQALDLVGRKVPAHTGRYLRQFFHPVQSWIESHAFTPALQPFVMPLAKAFGRLQLATGHIAQVGLKNPNEAAAASSEYLRLFGLVALGYLWARMVEVALTHGNGADQGFYDAKVATARHYMERILPQTGSLFAAIMAGASTMMDFPDEAF